jgi:hypothetical protein
MSTGGPKTCILFKILIYEVVSESFWTVIVVTASVKEDERGAKVTLLKAYCIRLPHDTAL